MRRQIDVVVAAEAEGVCLSCAVRMTYKEKKSESFRIFY
jgi:adenine/guanine phosphoribosyltransferase-like PRPP-binding protein